MDRMFVGHSSVPASSKAFPPQRTCKELVDRELAISIPIRILEPLVHLVACMNLTDAHWLHLDEFFEVKLHLAIVIYEVAER